MTLEEAYAERREWLRGHEAAMDIRSGWVELGPMGGPVPKEKRSLNGDETLDFDRFAWPRPEQLFPCPGMDSWLRKDNS